MNGYHRTGGLTPDLVTVRGLLFVPVQKPDSVHGHGYGAGVFIYFSFQETGPRCVQHVAVTVV
jgi:hypothetical protein